MTPTRDLQTFPPSTTAPAAIVTSRQNSKNSATVCPRRGAVVIDTRLARCVSPRRPLLRAAVQRPPSPSWRTTSSYSTGQPTRTKTRPSVKRINHAAAARTPSPRPLRGWKGCELRPSRRSSSTAQGLQVVGPGSGVSLGQAVVLPRRRSAYRCPLRTRILRTTATSGTPPRVS
jgi:hypothetical protein